MARSRKAREHTRSKLQAPKKKNASLKQENTKTTDQLSPTSYTRHSASYRMSSCSLTNPVEVFDWPAQLGCACSQQHQKTSGFSDAADPVALVRSMSRDIHALIESKKIATLPSSITTPSFHYGTSAAIKVEVFRGATNLESNHFTDSQEPSQGSHNGGATTTLSSILQDNERLAARPDGGEQEMMDTDTIDVCTLADPSVVTDGLVPAAELEDRYPYSMLKSLTQCTDQQHDPDGAHEQAKGDTLGESKNADISCPRPKLKAPVVHSKPATPVSPILDVDHASPTSSQSSLRTIGTMYEGKSNAREHSRGHSYTSAHRKEWSASRSPGYHPGRVVERLGPSIMFGLFGGVLE